MGGLRVAFPMRRSPSSSRSAWPWRTSRQPSWSTAVPGKERWVGRGALTASWASRARGAIGLSGRPRISHRALLTARVDSYPLCLRLRSAQRFFINLGNSLPCCHGHPPASARPSARGRSARGLSALDRCQTRAQLTGVDHERGQPLAGVGDLAFDPAESPPDELARLDDQSFSSPRSGATSRHQRLLPCLHTAYAAEVA